MENKKVWNPSSYGRYIKLLFVALVVVVICASALRHSTTDILTFIQRHARLGFFISLIIYTVLGATPIPSEPLTVFLVALYGPLPAVIAATIGNTLAAAVEFQIGGSIGDLTDFEKRKANLPFHLGQLPIDSPMFLLVGRMLPGFGPKFVSVACGIYRVPIFTYLWTVVLTSAVGAVIIAYGGYGLMKAF